MSEIFKKEWIKTFKEIPPEIKTNGVFKIYIDNRDDAAIEGYLYDGVFYMTAFQEVQQKEKE